MAELEDYNPFRSYAFDSEAKPSNDFREYLPPPGHPRTAGLDKADIHTYSTKIIDNKEASIVFSHYEKLLAKPFVGITTDGNKLKNVFKRKDEGAPVEAMTAAAETLLKALSEEERQKVSYDIDAIEWRKWSNPEILFNDCGLRVEFLDVKKVESIFGVVKASLSETGFKKVRDAMRTNHFLGELVNAKPILNELSYNFLLFGTPSTSTPWGWSLYGHHLCVNVFVLGHQMVVSPAFLGAEPNFIDEGEWNGVRILTTEAKLGLELMQSLEPELQEKARIYKRMHDPAMPEDRWHPADERHLGGAFHDNRIIPYEGVLASDLTSAQQQLLKNLIAAFLEILPPRVLAAHLEETKMEETYFSWIGRSGDEDPFYYRIQSPVICLEFDHHCGIFLMNSEPAKCHIHTVIRTPNGGDYGREILRLWREENGETGKGVGTIWS